MKNRKLLISKMRDLQRIVSSCIGTKFSSKWGNLIVDLAVKAVKTVFRKRRRLC